MEDDTPIPTHAVYARSSIYEGSVGPSGVQWRIEELSAGARAEYNRRLWAAYRSGIFPTEEDKSRMIDIIEKRSDWPWAPRETPPSRAQAKPVVVYYIRFSDRVKIGTTSHLPTRLSNIPHDEVLATEVGGYEVEHERHRQFADSRVVGEWFLLSADLVAHINGLRAATGEPPFQKVA